MTPDLRAFLNLYGEGRTLLLFDLFSRQEQIMAAIDDLTTKLATLSDTVATKVLPALQQIPAMKTQIADLTTQVATLAAQVQALQTQDPAIAAAASTVDSMNTALLAAVPAA